MKRSITVLIMLTVVSGTVLTRCNTPAQKVANAENNVTEANKELNIANEEYVSDINKNKKITEERVEANQKSMEAFKTRIAHEKKSEKAEYKTKIAELEKENSDMKMQMDEYKADGNEQWEKFKIEFNHNMDKLDNSIKKLTSTK
jgi:hypothetical protein